MLAALADGLGKSVDSRTASNLATSIAVHYLRTQRNADPEEAMHAAFLAAATIDPLPATTLLLAHLATNPVLDNELTLGWVGDTRAYLLPRDGANPRRLTGDGAHSGRVSNQLTRWLAADSPSARQVRTVPIQPGLVVLATDGAWTHLGSPRDMAALPPTEVWNDPSLAAELPTAAACANGAADDITIVVIEVPQAR